MQAVKTLRSCAALIGFLLAGVNVQANSLYTKPCDPYDAITKKHCWYAGVGVGLSSISPEPEESSIWEVTSDSASSAKLYLGLSFNDHVFTEISYENLGSATIENLNPNITPNSQSIGYQALSLSGGYWLRGRQSSWDVFAKGGLTSLSTDDGGFVEQEHSSQLSLGLGAELRFANQWVVRSEFTSFDADASSLTFSVSRHFGEKPKLQPKKKVTFKPKPKPKAKLDDKPKPTVKPKPKAKISVQPKPKTRIEVKVPPKPAAKPKLEIKVPKKPVVPQPVVPTKPKAQTQAKPEQESKEPGKKGIGLEEGWATKDKKIPRRPGVTVLPRSIDRDGDGIPNLKDRCPNTGADTEVDAEGCKVIFRKTLAIKFELNRAVIQNKYGSELDKLAQDLKGMGKVHILIEAYSDRNDDEIDSQLLSELRAAVVADMLILKTGIPDTAFTMVGFSEAETEDNKQQNRASRQRVVVTVSKR